MALIRLGLGSQASGSLGGTVFSHNRGGAYLRARSIPVNVQSPRQQFVRASMAAVVFAWTNTLTDTQRAAWDLYAANVSWTNVLGETTNLSGFNMFLRSSVSAADAGLPPLATAPVIFTLGELPTPPVATNDISAQTSSIAFTNTDNWANEDGGYVNLYAGRPYNAGVTFFNGPYQYLGTILGDGTTPPTSPAVFGPPLPFPIGTGQKLALRWRAGYADGRLSTFGRGTFLAVP